MPPSRRETTLYDLFAAPAEARPDRPLVIAPEGDLTYGEAAFMLTGDVEARVERALVRSGVYLCSTVLKVGHHGSQNATPEGDPLEAMLPEHPASSRLRIGVISALEAAYGHPHQDALDRLQPRLDTLVQTERTPPIDYIDVEFTPSGQATAQNGHFGT